MGMKEVVTYHDTEEQAREAQKRKGIRGYSEVYPRGVFIVRMTGPKGKVTKFKSIIKIYYG